MVIGDPFLNVDSKPLCVLNCYHNPLVLSLFLWWPGTPPPKPKRPPKELVVRYRVQEQEQEEVRPRSTSILQTLFRKWALFGEQVTKKDSGFELAIPTLLLTVAVNEGKRCHQGSFGQEVGGGTLKNTKEVVCMQANSPLLCHTAVSSPWMISKWKTGHDPLISQTLQYKPSSITSPRFWLCLYLLMRNRYPAV